MIILFDTVMGKAVEKIEGSIAQAEEMAMGYCNPGEKISQRPVKVKGGKTGICFSTPTDFEVVYFKS